VDSIARAPVTTSCACALAYRFTAFPLQFTPAGWRGFGAPRDVVLLNYDANRTHSSCREATGTACCRHHAAHGRQLLCSSAVAYFNKSAAAEALLTAWAEAMAYNANAADDRTLDLLVNDDGWIDRAAFGWLPASYLQGAKSSTAEVTSGAVIKHDGGIPASSERNSAVLPTLPPHKGEEAARGNEQLALEAVEPEAMAIGPIQRWLAPEGAAAALDPEAAGLDENTASGQHSKWPKPSHSLVVMDQALRLGEREASDLIAGEHNVEVELQGLGGGAAGDEADGPGGGSSASSSELRQLYRGRKFLFPLLDQGPNNQYLQFRVAIAKARALNRTLVLPLWLPHNPKFLHLHPGAPPEPSRDRATALLSFPFASTFDASHLAKFVRTIDLPAFRTLSDGRLDLCLSVGSSHDDDSGFRDYLRLSALSCSRFAAVDKPNEGRERAAAAHARSFGYHSYDRDVGLRDRVFSPLRWSGAVLSAAERVASQLNLTRGDYVAAHIRVADAHWEHSETSAAAPRARRGEDGSSSRLSRCGIGLRTLDPRRAGALRLVRRRPPRNQLQLHSAGGVARDAPHRAAHPLRRHKHGLLRHAAGGGRSHALHPRRADGLRQGGALGGAGGGGAGGRRRGARGRGAAELLSVARRAGGGGAGAHLCRLKVLYVDGHRARDEAGSGQAIVGTPSVRGAVGSGSEVTEAYIYGPTHPKWKHRVCWEYPQG